MTGRFPVRARRSPLFHRTLFFANRFPIFAAKSQVLVRHGRRRFLPESGVGLEDDASSQVSPPRRSSTIPGCYRVDGWVVEVNQTRHGPVTSTR